MVEDKNIGDSRYVNKILIFFTNIFLKFLNSKPKIIVVNCDLTGQQ